MTNTQNIKGLLGTKLGMTQVWDCLLYTSDAADE